MQALETEGRYQLPEFPPLVVPPEDEEKRPVMVVVGGERPVHIGEEVYKLRVAWQDKPGSDVRFIGRELPEGISLNQVQWVWLVYRRPQPPASPEPVFPSLAILLLEEERELLWWLTELEEGQKALVFGVNTPAGLRHFIPPDNRLGETARRVLVKGIWHQQEEIWKLQVIEWRQFDSEQNVYIVPIE